MHKMKQKQKIKWSSSKILQVHKRRELKTQVHSTKKTKDNKGILSNSDITKEGIIDDD